jgi:hypothetical protein
VAPPISRLAVEHQEREDELAFVRAGAEQLHVARAWRCGLALVEAIRGDHEAAVRHLEAAGRPAEIDRDVNWPSGMWEQGAAAMLLGDVARAREVRDLLAPFAGMTVTAVRTTCIFGPVASLLSRLDAFLAAAGSDAAPRRSGV